MTAPTKRSLKPAIGAAKEPAFEKRNEKYECVCCHEEKKPTDFYKSPTAAFWDYPGSITLVCKQCVRKQFDRDVDQYGLDNAIMFTCYRLDQPYIKSTAEDVKVNTNPFDIGVYLGSVSRAAYTGKSFAWSLLSGEINRDDDNSVKEEREDKWSKRDRQNMNYVISIIGYDPFDDAGLSNMDRKYCYNVLSSYLNTPYITDDSHKMQSVIQLTNTLLQVRKLDEAINREQLKANTNTGTLTDMVMARKNLQTIVNAIVKDNNIASQYSKEKTGGENTLTGKMRELTNNGYEAMKVNLFDIKTSEAMKQIADLSNSSIMEQLSLDANDYTEMLKEQRTMLTDLREKADALEEENRQLKNNLENLIAESSAKRKRGGS